MSYLNSPNLVFTGDFMADTATVNNDVRHYDNANFEAYFQDPSVPKDPNGMNGWWNPEGGAVFNLQNCTVQQISFPDGSLQRVDGGTDPVLGKLAGGPQGRSLGKMIDLDPQWQMSSQLWCVKLRIYSETNEVLLSGDIAVSGFRDLQSRQTGTPVNGQPMGGGWTSVLTNLVWGAGAGDSPFLMALKEATHGDMLSIQLNMFGYYYSHQDGRFGMGRIIGVVGPWFRNEPLTFAPNRRLYGIMDWGKAGIYFNYSNFLVDEANARLTADLGSSFPITDSMGTIGNNDMLKKPQYLFGVLKGSSDFAPPAQPAPPAVTDWDPVYVQDADVLIIGAVDYSEGDNSWLNTTGGIVSLPLTADQLTLLEDHQLVLLTPSNKNPGQYVIVSREAIGGYNVRADNLNERLENGRTVTISLYAYQWGKPLAGNRITFAIQPKTQAFFGGQMQGSKAPKAAIPYINFPVEGISLAAEAETDATGRCDLPVTGNKIDWPRGYVDGQMYYITYLLNGEQPDAAAYGMDSIYISLRSYYEVPEKPTWDDISATMIQYGNVYPVMSKYVVDLTSEAAVLLKKEILTYAFTRSIDDPMYMPVTRDLSEAMRETIVKWLANPLPGKNLSGPAPVPEAALTAAAATDSPGLEESDEIKKVKKLTEQKNGATAVPVVMPLSFDDL